MKVWLEARGCLMANKKTAYGAGSIRKRTIVRKGNTYTFWEGRAVVGYDPATGKPIRRTISGKTQNEVRQRLSEIVHSVDNGTYMEPLKLTVGAWVQEWLDVYASLTVKPYTLSTYRMILKNHIRPLMGNMQIQGLKGNHIQRFYNQLKEKGLSAKSIKNIATVLHKALGKAVVLGYIPSNPCDAAELPRVRTKDIHPLTDEEIPKFLKVINGHPMGNAYAVCMFCGLREGELLGLSWDRVNFEKQEITISQQLQRSKEKGVGYLLLDTTKSGRPRTIKPPPIAFDYLRAERTAQKERQLRAGSAWDNSWNLVFTNASGQHYAIHTFYKEYKKLVAQIGRPDARPHDLRHTCATVAIASGSDIKSVQDLMGHATAAFTLDRYAHTSEKMKQDTADRLQAYYESLQA